MDKKVTIGDAAKYLGVSRDTLRRWEKKGKISPLRSPSNRRYYTKDQLDSLLAKPKKSPPKQTSQTNQPKTSGSLKLVAYSLAAVLTAVILGYLAQILLF